MKIHQNTCEKEGPYRVNLAGIGGGTYGGNLELSKTHVSNDFLGYLEHKTLNMYGSIFQKDPPPGKSLF